MLGDVIVVAMMLCGSGSWVDVRCRARLGIIGMPLVLGRSNYASLGGQRRSWCSDFGCDDVVAVVEEDPTTFALGCWTPRRPQWPFSLAVEDRCDVGQGEAEPSVMKRR
jgi:hypothetical protein